MAIAVVVTSLFLGLMPSASAASPTTAPISTSTSVTGSGNVGFGKWITVNFDQAVTVSSSYTLTLTDGVSVGTLSSSNTWLFKGSGNTSVTFFIVGAPKMKVGSSLPLKRLEVLSQTGIGNSVGPWNLAVSGTIVTGTASGLPKYSRVFGGTNADLTKPLAPDIYDIIPVPTADLPGPPSDYAPEVITSCSPGTTNTVFDAHTGAVLGSAPCGTTPPGAIPSNGLDYISTPTLRSYQTVVVTQTATGVTGYESAPGAPPEITSATLVGTTATVTFNQPVTCTVSPQSISQFKLTVPASSVNKVNDTYASGLVCPAAAGGTTLKVTFPTAPAPGQLLRLKYEGYGEGAYVLAGSTAPRPALRAPSQSMLVTAS